MSAALCSVSGCDGKAKARGWCKSHYGRWLTHGDVRADEPLRRMTPKAASSDEAYRRAAADEVFIERIRRDCVRGDGGCLLWQGACTGNGYGHVKYADHNLFVHIVMLMAATGERPADLEAGHVCHDLAAHDGTCDGRSTCRHRPCCEPSHLEWQSREANGASSPLTFTSINSAKETCPQGHPLVEGNLVPSHLARGKRRCLICDRERSRHKAVAIKAAHEALGLKRDAYVTRFGHSHHTAEAVTDALASGVPASRIITDAATFRAVAPGRGRCAA